MITQGINPEEIIKTIGLSKSIVNEFYQVSFDYPVIIAENTIDILKSGLLPWAKSGLRKNIVIRIPGISQNQVTHEMSHFALRKITHYHPLPLWFDEGLACYISNMNFIGDKQKLATALISNPEPGLMHWVGFTGKLHWLHQMYVRKNTALIYGLSYYFIEYLYNHFKKEDILNFIQNLADANFSDSFKKFFHQTETDLFKDFTKTLINP